MPLLATHIRSLLRCMTPQMALLGPREMSDLSPQSGPKRTLDQVAVTNRDFMGTRPRQIVLAHWTFIPTSPTTSSLPPAIAAARKAAESRSRPRSKDLVSEARDRSTNA